MNQYDTEKFMKRVEDAAFKAALEHSDDPSFYPAFVGGFIKKFCEVMMAMIDEGDYEKVEQLVRNCEQGDKLQIH